MGYKSRWATPMRNRECITNMVSPDGERPVCHPKMPIRSVKPITVIRTSRIHTFMNIGMKRPSHECICKALIFKLVSHSKFVLMPRKMLCALNGIYEGHGSHTIT